MWTAVTYLLSEYVQQTIHRKPSNIGTTQNVTKNHGPMYLSDDSISGRGKNSLDATPKLMFSLHLALFNVRTITKK